MVVADTLSRYSPEDTPEILLDISVHHVYIDAYVTGPPGAMLFDKDQRSH